MRSLEGANCADLPPFVAAKYFECNVSREPLKAMVAKAICAKCTVVEECRSEALKMPNIPASGVIAGMNVARVRDARRWRNYELGITEKAPEAPRPEWLPMTDATQQVEQTRLESDPDEPPPEI